MTILPEKEDTETHTQDIDYAVSLDLEAYQYQNRFRTYKIKILTLRKFPLYFRIQNTEPPETSKVNTIIILILSKEKSTI